MRARLIHLPFLVLLAMMLVALVMPATASAQATRTWVSGVGDDANPCSRTAPCKTFAGAISKTAVGGEINCLDPGGFGGVTITKSISIICDYTEGGVLVGATNAIVINAGANDKVVLSGLDINGIGTGINGIRVLQAKSVKVRNTDIYGFVRNGVDFEPTNASARMILSDVRIRQNAGNGVLNAPPASGAGARITITDSEIVDNYCGVTSTSHRADTGGFGILCGTTAADAGGAAGINVFRSTIDAHAGTGALSNGNAYVQLGGTVLTGNSPAVNAIDVIGGGGVFTWGDNFVTSNSPTGTFTGTRALA